MGQAVNSVSVNNFPGLKTQGISLGRADLEVGGVAMPHVHPRATEAVFVLEGAAYARFVDTQYKVFAKVLEQGEVMVIPRGLAHFHLNLGEKQATLLGIYNSENPRMSMISTALCNLWIMLKQPCNNESMHLKFEAILSFYVGSMLASSLKYVSGYKLYSSKLGGALDSMVIDSLSVPLTFMAKTP
ncbi:unnamed protein product [Dovyalis caffra]|uniref:Germin-like protein n=1 Tax=Dovyalis caffra TaxID=77055 RepID=A0AAV1QYP2_9ROSI|nr:unnamed protein product [Dovyalis caffra]